MPKAKNSVPKAIPASKNAAAASKLDDLEIKLHEAYAATRVAVSLANITNFPLADAEALARCTFGFELASKLLKDGLTICLGIIEERSRSSERKDSVN